MCLKQDNNKTIDQLIAEHQAAQSKPKEPVQPPIIFSEGVVVLTKPNVPAEEPVQRGIFYIKLSKPKV